MTKSTSKAKVRAAASEGDPQGHVQASGAPEFAPITLIFARRLCSWQKGSMHVALSGREGKQAARKGRRGARQAEASSTS